MNLTALHMEAVFGEVYLEGMGHIVMVVSPTPAVSRPSIIGPHMDKSLEGNQSHMLKDGLCWLSLKLGRPGETQLHSEFLSGPSVVTEDKDIHDADDDKFLQETSEKGDPPTGGYGLA
ncbi:hypothetical protein C5167_042882 [Papaver somniferum]|uniref:Uncharacterized protein n=1 Tax=Papaver somniferum TaxID=3469 RepID=A0A4Y7L544_PAPSO|nr:hypothetical protein C5167_042882 [Papaver somniferum]